MTENMKKLLEFVSCDKELFAKIDGMGKEDVITLANELGVAFTEADFVQNRELPNDELDAVAGLHRSSMERSLVKRIMKRAAIIS